MADYSALRATGKLHGTIKRAVALAKSRAAAKSFVDPLAVPLADRHKKAKRIIPLGGAGVEAANAIREKNKRLKNWTMEKAGFRTELRTNDLGRYSSRCKYTHYTYTPMIESYGVAAGGAMWFRFDGSTTRIKAPRGYRWGLDRNGVRLFSIANPKDDYHPTAADLLEGAHAVVAKLRENKKTRVDAAKKTKRELAMVRRAERDGATVCLADSMKAGNCYAGSASWAERHGLNPSGHYKPSEVLARANGDASRVAIVVAVALKRHRDEMLRGYALLVDHGVK